MQERFERPETRHILNEAFADECKVYFKELDDSTPLPEIVNLNIIANKNNQPHITKDEKRYIETLSPLIEKYPDLYGFLYELHKSQKAKGLQMTRLLNALARNLPLREDDILNKYKHISRNHDKECLLTVGDYRAASDEYLSTLRDLDLGARFLKFIFGQKKGN